MHVIIQIDRNLPHFLQFILVQRPNKLEETSKRNDKNIQDCKIHLQKNLMNRINWNYWRLPWSMITDNRIFSRNFVVYGRLPWDMTQTNATLRSIRILTRMMSLIVQLHQLNKLIRTRFGWSSLSIISSSSGSNISV